MLQTQNITVRVRHSDRDTRIRKAAKSAVACIRRQVELSGIIYSKEELARRMWKVYWRMYQHRLLAAPATTRRMLRSQLGLWDDCGVRPCSRWVRRHNKQ